MKKLFLLILVSALHHTSLFAEKDIQKIAQEIVTEGKTLYKVDMASWYGTDVMQAQYKGDINKIGGYFSYLNGDKRICIFYSKDNFNKIVFEVDFDSTYSIQKANVSNDIRPFNSKEQELFDMREKARSIALTDTSIKHYKNTTLNLIPLIYNGERRVYIITGTSEDHMVPLGNDYLITFDKTLKIQKTRKIHVNLIPIENPNSDTALVSMHSHLSSTGDFITPTDICTIMEYEKLEKWKSHCVISENYVSIWDCEKDDLLILTKKAWEKIAKKD